MEEAAGSWGGAWRMSEYSATVKEGEYFLLTHYVTRKIAYPLAKMFRAIGFSPNTVTVIGGISWVVSAILVVLGGALLGQGEFVWGWVVILTAAFLWNVGAILDVVDGSLARLTNSGSRAGSYLDFVFHVIHGPLFLSAIALAIGLATGYELIFAIVAMAAVPVNLGTSQHAKDHVLCEDLAKGECDLELFEGDEIYQLFVDSPQRKAGVGEKSSGSSLLVQILFELIMFPAQFETFGLLMIFDWLIWIWTGWMLPLTTFLVCGTVLLGAIRIPFRVRREYRRVAVYDEIRKRAAEKCV